jgi:hypothetical protein
MRLFVSFCIVFTFLFSLFNCTVKRDNGERTNLKLYGYTTVAGVSQEYCFDDVRGVNREKLTRVCSNGQNSSIEMPLNIAQDSSVFFLIKGARKDTIVITYRNIVKEFDGAYINRYANLKIKKATIPNFKCPCFQALSDTIFCDDQDFSAYFFF